MKTTVSEKGQITIPKPLREKLGLRAGVVIEFKAQAGKLIGRKAMAKDSVDSVVGILGQNIDPDEEINRMRGKPWNPEDDAPRANRR